MPTYYVPVAVNAASAEDAEQWVEGALKGKKYVDLPEVELDWVGDAELQEDGDD